MIEIFGVRLRRLEKQELTDLCHQIIISFITAISFSRSHEDYKIGTALFSPDEERGPDHYPRLPRRGVPDDRGRHYLK